jgi:hypothetical protein
LAIYAASWINQLRKSSSAASQSSQAVAAATPFVIPSRCPFSSPFHAGFLVGAEKHPDARASAITIARLFSRNLYMFNMIL